MQYCQLAALLSLAWSLSASAEQTTRVWHFDLKVAGTYKVQVEHDVKGSVPNGTMVTYSFTVGKKTQSRDLNLVADRPFLPLIVDIPNPDKMRVVVTGLPESALKRTSVYVFDANSQFPGESFDPSKSIELKSAQRLQAILRNPDEQIDLARTKLAIDKMVDPSVDVDANLTKIDAIVASIRAMPEFSTDKLAALPVHHLRSEARPRNDGVHRTQAPARETQDRPERWFRFFGQGCKWSSARAI